MIVFLLGIPGCGKSEVYRRLTGKLRESGLFSSFPRVDDFPKLWDIFMKDRESGEWKRSRPTDDGGYKVIDDSVWDDILVEVNRDVTEMINNQSQDTLIFVEFSRPNYVHSISANFSGEILGRAAIVYLDVPFDTCWERNVRRHEKALEAGTDDHLVSREEMEKTYGSDDKGDLAKLSIPYIVIQPDAKQEGDFTKLIREVDKVYGFIKDVKEKR
ncbi:MAG: hypothetical protein JXJ19_10030 [Elusimicrobia bacterium]|nr:hypothetical protein [Elusimicrobiota bacterium]